MGHVKVRGKALTFLLSADLQTEVPTADVSMTASNCLIFSVWQDIIVAEGLIGVGAGRFISGKPEEEE